MPDTIRLIAYHAAAFAAFLGAQTARAQFSSNFEFPACLAVRPRPRGGRRLHRAVAAIVGAGLALAGFRPAYGQTFTGLGMLPGQTRSTATGVSADGSVVVGMSGDRSYRWTSAGGMVDLGLPSGWLQCTAMDVSGDGSVVIGFAGRQPSSGAILAFKWTSQGGFVPLPISASPGFAGLPFSISTDGATIAGSDGYTIGGNHVSRAVTWTTAGETQLPVYGSYPSAYATGVSGDGSVVVGNSGGACRWAASQVFALGPSVSGSQGNGASQDGSVIVGNFGGTAYTLRPFRWTAGTGATPLDLPPDSLNDSAAALSVSGDGSTMIGTYWVQDPSPSAVLGIVLWSPQTGTVNLATYLTAHGVNLAGWVLADDYGIAILGDRPRISADGLSIVGTGIHNGQGEAWIVHLAMAGACYPNCDGSTVAPILNVNDFQCFLNRFAAGDSYANCDGSTTDPILNVNDFQCFLNSYAAGCP